jgi:hypothetical protein
VDDMTDMRAALCQRLDRLASATADLRQLALADLDDMPALAVAQSLVEADALAERAESLADRLRYAAEVTEGLPDQPVTVEAPQ